MGAAAMVTWALAFSGAVAAAAAGWLAPVPVAVPIAVAAAALWGLVSLEARRRRLGRLLAVVAAALAGGARFHAAADTVISGRLAPRLDGATVWVTGTVSDLPRCDPRACRFVLVAGVTRGGDALPPRVRIAWPSRLAPARLPAPGERWRLAVRLARPRALVNPGAFDYERYLFAHRIGATGYVAPHPGNGRIAVATRPSPARVRAFLVEAVDRAYPGRDAGRITRALGLGDVGRLTEHERDVLEKTGTTHLFAISGLHVGLVTAAAAWLGRYTFALSGGWRRLPAQAVGIVIGLAVSAVYAALSGSGIPARRAWLMAAIGALSFMARGQAAGGTTLAVALAVLLAIDPLAIASGSLWLSACAVTAIWAIVAGRIARPVFWRVSMATSAAMLPVTALVFGQMPAVSPAVNLVAIPVVSFVLVPAAIALTLLAPLAAGTGIGLVPGALAGLVDVVWAALVTCLSHAAALPLATPSAAHLGLSGAVGLGLAAAVSMAPFGLRLRVPVAAVLVLLATTRDPDPVRTGQVAATFVDVGQGQAVVLRTRHRVYLYDTGPKALDYVAATTTVLPVLARLGVGTLDAVVVSHRDIDHVGGAQVIAAALPVRRWFTSPGFAIEFGARACVAGASWVADGVQFEFLAPPARTTATRNDASCILKVTSAGGRVLVLTGDIEASAERALLAEGADLAADIVSVPHHGSATSSTPAFVRALAPAVAVNSSGHGNRWGFPAPEVRRRYAAAGARFLDTADLGAVCARLDATVDVRACERRPPRWRRARE